MSYINILHWLDTNNMYIRLVNMTLVVDYITNINTSSQLAACDIAKVP